MKLMFTNVLQENLTFGQAMDECTINGRKIARKLWGGYWELKDVELRIQENVHRTESIVVAVLKDNKGWAPATPYTEDMTAMDWMVVK